jgi:hypothetical protein
MIALSLSICSCGGSELETDGAARDGGSRDAGALDALDATAPDATSPDATAPDAGTDAFVRVEPLACEVAPGGCDEVITDAGGTWISITHRHIPGRVICIAAGNYSQLYLEDVTGDEGNPVTIINCGGRVHFDSSGQQVGIQGLRVQHLHLSGTGDPGEPFGLEQYGGGLHGVDFDQGITDIEIDHLEVHHDQWVGIGVRSYPRCDGAFNRSNWTQYDTVIHDNWVHDLAEGEGLYIGTSHYEQGGLGYLQTCPELGYLEPPLRRVRVYDNVVSDVGADGIQVGSAIEGMEIARNVVRHYALTQDAGDVGGLQINPGSVGEVHHNWIESFVGDLAGTAVQYAGGDAGDVDIHDNVIVGAPTAFMTLGLMIGPGNQTIFRDNTIVERGMDPMGCTRPAPMPDLCQKLMELYCNAGLTAAAPHRISITGNLFVGYDHVGPWVFDDEVDRWFRIFGGRSDACPIDGHVYSNAREPDLQIPGNFYAMDVADAHFADADAGDYHVAAGSVAAGFGADLDAVPRPHP